ncbi:MULTISPECIES: phage portal protein [Pacificimonas]|uniref:phage portal protein n=1 Tax=Pacificimonas TaxID=1960290 RepID=UPI0026C4A7D9|nr:phage portal protein [Pacificimonas aurantium]
MFNWLSRKSAPPATASRPRFPAMLLGMEDADPPRGYHAQAKAALEHSPVASRSIRLVAEAAGTVPLTIGGPPEVRTLLTRPNIRMAGSAFLEKIAAHLVLNGNAYIEAVTDGRGMATGPGAPCCWKVA